MLKVPMRKSLCSSSLALLAASSCADSTATSLIISYACVSVGFVGVLRCVCKCARVSGDERGAREGRRKGGKETGRGKWGG